MAVADDLFSFHRGVAGMVIIMQHNFSSGPMVSFLVGHAIYQITLNVYFDILMDSEQVDQGLMA